MKGLKGKESSRSLGLCASSSSESPINTIETVARIRPLLSTESSKRVGLRKAQPNSNAKERQSSEFIELEHRDCLVQARFNKVFDQDSSQQTIFKHFEPCIGNFLKGTSSCILAYGHTGSGKTFTMFGPNWTGQQSSGQVKKRDPKLSGPMKFQIGSNVLQETILEPNSVGLVPLVAKTILRQTSSSSSSLSVKMYQIYNERILDLLSVN